MHITLKFLGSVPAASIDEMVARVRRGIAESFRKGPAPRFVARGLSAFPGPARPRVLFAELQGETGDELQRLVDLQASLDGWLAELGYEKEARAFTPHLTLGRVRDGRGASQKDLKDALSDLFAKHAGRRYGEAFQISELILYESRLHHDGAQYVALHRLPLYSEAFSE
jgi:2'-5' RNA ligase